MFVVKVYTDNYGVLCLFKVENFLKKNMLQLTRMKC